MHVFGMVVQSTSSKGRISGEHWGPAQNELSNDSKSGQKRSDPIRHISRVMSYDPVLLDRELEFRDAFESEHITDVEYRRPGLI
jgi:hypothetical protein